MRGDYLIKLLSLFSGIGAFEKALKNLNIDFEVVNYCEINKYASLAYSLIHNESEDKNLRDITKININELQDYIYIDNDVIKWYTESALKIMEDNMAGCLKKMTLKGIEEAVKMYEKGLSLQDIALYFDVSRQSIHQLLKKKINLRPQKRLGNDNNFYRGGIKANDKTQNILESAIRKGIVVRKTHCELCGESGVFKDGRTKIQAHHFDYNKPLDVMWLCQKCHHEWHKNNKVIEKEVKKESQSQDNILMTYGFP